MSRHRSPSSVRVVVALRTATAVTVEATRLVRALTVLAATVGVLLIVLGRLV